MVTQALCHIHSARAWQHKPTQHACRVPQSVAQSNAHLQAYRTDPQGNKSADEDDAAAAQAVLDNILSAIAPHEPRLAASVFPQPRQRCGMVEPRYADESAARGSTFHQPAAMPPQHGGAPLSPLRHAGPRADFSHAPPAPAPSNAQGSGEAPWAHSNAGKRQRDAASDSASVDAWPLPKQPFRPPHAHYGHRLPSAPSQQGAGATACAAPLHARPVTMLHGAGHLQPGAALQRGDVMALQAHGSDGSHAGAHDHWTGYTSSGHLPELRWGDARISAAGDMPQRAGEAAPLYPSIAMPTCL